MKKLLLAIALAVALPARAAPDLRYEPAQAWLDAHNAERALVSVPPLRWSASAEAKAKAWAERLALSGEFEHSSTQGMGENLFATSYWHPPKATEIIESWASEKADFNRKTRQCEAGSDCGHYTQVVWQNTTEVGCATAYRELPEDSESMRYLVVCNYLPPGNYRGQPAYDLVNHVTRRPTLHEEMEGRVAEAAPELGTVIAAPPPCNLKPYRNAETERWGYKDAGGAVVVEPEYVEAKPFGRTGLAVAFDEDDTWFYVDCEGETFDVMENDKGSSADAFSEGLVRYTDDERIGYLNYAGEIVIPAKFPYAATFCGKVAVVSEDSSRSCATGPMWRRQCDDSYFIDQSGKRVPEPPASAKCKAFR